MQGGMFWLASADLAAAVSNAGGLGTITAYGGMAMDGDPLVHLQAQIVRARSLTSRAFAVNILLDHPLGGALLELALSADVEAIVTSSGDPGIYTPLLKSCGVTVLHVVTSVSQAVRAERAGVDAVIVQGIEAGGRHSPGSVPLFSLLPTVVHAVRLPVIAAGGIVDGRGIAAALGYGAEAAQLGTRFIATSECPAHAVYKRAIVDAGAGSTVLTCGATPGRCLDTGFLRRMRALECAGASAEEVAAARPYRGAAAAQLAGRLDLGELYCTAAVELIRDIQPVATLMEQLRQGMVAGNPELAAWFEPVTLPLNGKRGDDSATSQGSTSRLLPALT